MAWDDLRLRVVSRTAGISWGKGSNSGDRSTLLFISPLKDPLHPHPQLVPITSVSHRHRYHSPPRPSPSIHPYTHPLSSQILVFESSKPLSAAGWGPIDISSVFVP